MMTPERIKAMNDSAMKELEKEAEKYPDIKILLDDYKKLQTQKWSEEFLKGYWACISDLRYVKKML